MEPPGKGFCWSIGRRMFRILKLYIISRGHVQFLGEKHYTLHSKTTCRQQIRSSFVSTLGATRSLDENGRLRSTTAWSKMPKTMFEFEVLTHADQEWKVSQLCHGPARRQTRPGKSAMAASTSNGPGGICKAAGNSGRFH